MSHAQQQSQRESAQISREEGMGVTFLALALTARWSEHLSMPHTPPCCFDRTCNRFQSSGMADDARRHTSISTADLARDRVNARSCLNTSNCDVRASGQQRRLREGRGDRHSAQSANAMTGIQSFREVSFQPCFVFGKRERATAGGG